MKNYILISIVFFLSCNNWNRDKIQPFASLELSQSEFNLTFGDANVGGDTIDFGSGYIVAVPHYVKDTIIIRNTGSTPLVIDSVTSSHPLFFYVNEGENQIVIPANATYPLVLTLIPHDYVTEYNGEVKIHSNHSGGVKVIPVNAYLDCNSDGVMCGGGDTGTSCIEINIPTNKWHYSSNYFDCVACRYLKGFDIKIISLDTLNGKFTVEWEQHSDINYETATVQALLYEVSGNIQYNLATPITTNTNISNFSFSLNIQDIRETNLTLIFDTYKNGVRTVYYSPTIWMCI